MNYLLKKLKAKCLRWQAQRLEQELFFIPAYTTEWYLTFNRVQNIYRKACYVEGSMKLNRNLLS